METTTLKEVEGAMPVKNQFKYIRGLDNQGNPIKVAYTDIFKSGNSLGDTQAKLCLLAKYAISDTETNTDICFILHSAYSHCFAILLIEARGGSSVYGKLIASYGIDKNNIRIYYNDAKTEIELYHNDKGGYANMNSMLLYSTNRTGYELKSVKTYQSNTTPPSFTTFINPTFETLQNTINVQDYINAIGVKNSGTVSLMNTDDSCAITLIKTDILKALRPYENSKNAIDLGTSTQKFKNLYLSGQTYQSSDETLKDIQSNVSLTLEQIANAPNIKFTWKPKQSDTTTIEEPAEPKEEKMRVGTTAQYLKSVLPEVVTGEEGNMSVDYATAALIFAVQTAKHLETANKRIADLEARIAALEAKQ